MIPTFGLRIKPHLAEYHNDVDSITKFSISEIPPWLFKEPEVIFDCDKLKKSTTNPALFHEKFHSIRSQYKEYMEFYTDGSKDGDKVAAASVTATDNSIRVSDMSSVFFC